MSKLSQRTHRRILATRRRVRELKMIAKGLVSTDHPVMAHIIPIRRCNLACKYCNEFDDFSKPIPLETMKRRVDDLARLGTTIVTLSGGEPLLHPELDELIAHMRTYPIIVGHDHQRLPADRRSHPAPEPRRTRPSADQHRQRNARRRIEEVAEGARQETPDARRTR